MNEERLRELMRDPAPGEREAEERSLAVAHAAFEARSRSSVRPRGTLVLVTILALLAGALLAVTPAGGEITNFIGDRFGSIEGEEPSQPALVSLPSGGQILVNSARGPWVVKPDGSRRLLGNYETASWSPRGLFVIATEGRQLVALTPEGNIRWSLARAQPVSRARWSPSGFRIAYLSGSTLRVVNGDGSGDRRLAGGVTLVAPAWQPRARNRLAYVDDLGRLVLVDVDTGARIWRVPLQLAGTPMQLAWSADGQRLLAVGGKFAAEFDDDGRFVKRVPQRLQPSSAPGYAAYARTGHSFALIRRLARGRHTEVTLIGAGRQRRLFAGPGGMTDIAWSPNGKWLLVVWPGADQWLFLRKSGGRPIAVSDIARQFDPGGDGDGGYPSVSGWCCPP